MYVREGFLGQRLRVIPRPVIDAVKDQPILRRFLVTDAGYFPHAAEHGRARANGASETVVIVCTDGAGWVELGDSGPTRVERGDAVVLPAGLRHRYQADRDDPWSIWWLHVTGEDADDFVVANFSGESDAVVTLHDIFTVVQSFEEAVAALEADETVPTLVVASGAAWRVLAQVTASRLRGAIATNDRIRHVQDYLRNNLDTSFSVPELAAMAGLSTSYFSALFRTSAGTSVKEYLKRLRSARARELLITTELSIAEVAFAVGYDDALYFSRQFRVVNGVSPSEFRRHADSESLTSA